MTVRVLILLLSSAASMASLICAILAVRKKRRLEQDTKCRQVTIVLESGLSRTIIMTEAELVRLLGAG